MFVRLEKNPIVYVTRDLERALGLPLDTKGYFIISNYSAFAKSLIKNCPNILLIRRAHILDTHELLNSPETIQFINKIKNANIVVFKNTACIEAICQKYQWHLLNPAANLSEQVEQKITGTAWLGPLKKNLPPHQIIECGQIIWSGRPFILQFNRAHTGGGTILVQTSKQVEMLRKKFPARPVRVMPFVVGPVFTNNNVIWQGKVFIGNISYQITGLKPFTRMPFATIGNDWRLAHTLLSPVQIKAYHNLVLAIGKRLAQFGWRGLFGVDMILNVATGKFYLLEINARQPASAVYESKLQARKAHQGLTVFAAHLLALLDAKCINRPLTAIEDGAQIVQKVVKREHFWPRTRWVAKFTSKWQAKHWDFFQYNNTILEKDALRIQTPCGLMSHHNCFNDVGVVLRDQMVDLFSLS